MSVIKTESPNFKKAVEAYRGLNEKEKADFLEKVVHPDVEKLKEKKQKDRERLFELIDEIAESFKDVPIEEIDRDIEEAIRYARSKNP